MKASDYLKTRIWHGLIDEEASIPVIAELGVDQVVWGSDFPHTISMGAETGAILTALFEGITPDDQAKLVAENAERLFGLA